MKRRDLLKYSSYGALVAAVNTYPIRALADSCGDVSPDYDVAISLAIMRQRVEMVDGKKFWMLGYKDLCGGLTTNFPGDINATSTGARIPGPVLRVKHGQRVKITIDNTRAEPHSFEVTGFPDSKFEIPAFSSASATFVANQCGTFLYHDNYGNSPLNRLLGLHGAIIVQPDYDALRAAGALLTPYAAGQLTPQARSLFEAFGTSSRFPGGKWEPCAIDQPFSTQEKIWLETQVDPKFNALIPDDGNAAVLPNPYGPLWESWQPRYFTINGRSGFDLSRHEDVVAKNFIGEPTLIRCLNAGLAHHSNHIHGNHVFEVAESEFTQDPLGRNTNSGPMKVLTNIPERDVWPMWPMQRCDMILPFEVPPDIPYDIKIGGVPQPAQFQAMLDRNVRVGDHDDLVSQFEPFPLRYVMHCHCEMSQTAGGGNYPQGLVTHWELMGGIGGRAQLASSGNPGTGGG